MSRRWQYKVVQIRHGLLGMKTEAIEEALAQLGLQGWELVSAMPYGATAHLYLKKEY